MHRAIVIFVENKPHLITEMKVLLSSLQHISCLDTDLVVFGTKQALLRIPPECIKVEALAVGNRPQWKNYHYINSLACLSQPNSSILDRYTHLLRCDADTLLTPAWNTFYPDGYMCGKGRYVNDDSTKEKLICISQKLGLRHQGIFNTGSSHYGETRLVKDVCKLSLEIAQYILKTEFLLDEGRWPSWFKGVISLYASDLAVNHLIDSPLIDGEHLDYHSDRPDDVSLHPHIHCWHTNKPFSKFAFERGDYNHLSPSTLDFNKVNEYCLAMALKSLGK